jgi:hypothetical protein
MPSMELLESGIELLGHSHLLWRVEGFSSWMATVSTSGPSGC